jgi:hypothetical protein
MRTFLRETIMGKQNHELQLGVGDQAGRDDQSGQ